MAPRATAVYTAEQMANAVKAVRDGGMKKLAAARTFGVPRATLQDKLVERTPLRRRMGRPPHLTHTEETSVVEWIRRCARRGLPPQLSDVLNSVQNIIKSDPVRETPFKNGPPGKDWFKAFKRRHREISVRTPERVSKARASVTEDSIRQWFDGVLTELSLIGRIFNCDETNIQLCPKTGKVIGFRGWKNIYEISPGPEKSTLTFLGMFSASAAIVTPMVIYPYQRVPKDIIESVPEGFFIGNTESGWMKSECFFEYLANAFIPWLDVQEVKRPVILYVDGHSTHLTLQVSSLCEVNGLILYFLPPNTTHILQPADVGPFKPLKDYWKREVHNFHRENPNSVVQRVNVAPLLKKVLDRVTPQSISSGFRATGLYPFNPDKPDFSKCILSGPEISSDNSPTAESVPEVSRVSMAGDGIIKTNHKYAAAIEVIEEVLGKNKTDCLKKGSGLEVDDLYNLWTSLQDRASTSETSTTSAQPENVEILIERMCDAVVIEDLVLEGESFDLEWPEIDDVPESVTQDAVVPPHNDIPCEISHLEKKQIPSANVVQPSNELLSQHIFWEGAVVYKKHKPPKEKIPSCISSSKYRDYYMNKEENRKQRKKTIRSSDDWQCLYCSIFWSADNKKKNEKKWINCDDCDQKMHVHCVSQAHLKRMEYDSDDEEMVFSCQSCFKKKFDVTTG